MTVNSYHDLSSFIFRNIFEINNNFAAFKTITSFQINNDWSIKNVYIGVNQNLNKLNVCQLVSRVICRLRQWEL